jgi:hypothetical protein
MTVAEGVGEERPRTLDRVVKVVAVLAELGWVAVGIFEIYMFADLRRAPGPSESHAYGGMGLVAIMAGGMPFTIFGTLAALFLGWRAWIRWRTAFGSVIPVVWHGSVLGVTALVALQFVLPEYTPAPRTTSTYNAPIPESARDKRMAGYVWAMDNGVASASECVGPSPEFVAACKRYLEEHPPQPAH